MFCADDTENDSIGAKEGDVLVCCCYLKKIKQYLSPKWREKSLDDVAMHYCYSIVVSDALSCLGNHRPQREAVTSHVRISSALPGFANSNMSLSGHRSDSTIVRRDRAEGDR